MRYQGTVYRPPSEAGSLIIQATLACPHNKCAFCGMYQGRRFHGRPIEEVVEDLDSALQVYGPEPRSVTADPRGHSRTSAHAVER